jgi:hypothetical protein
MLTGKHACLHMSTYEIIQHAVLHDVHVFKGQTARPGNQVVSRKE